MALYFVFNPPIRTALNQTVESFEWHVGKPIPFFPISLLQEIQADGHEKEYLLKIHVLHSLFGGRQKIDEKVINTFNRDAALVCYGMMLREQAIEKFGR